MPFNQLQAHTKKKNRDTDKWKQMSTTFHAEFVKKSDLRRQKKAYGVTIKKGLWLKIVKRLANHVPNGLK